MLSKVNEPANRLPTTNTFQKLTFYLLGHPYEPLLAVSGIDHTIKIFSPDRKAQRDARLGINLGVRANRSYNTSSLRGLSSRRRRRSPSPTTDPDPPQQPPPNTGDSEDEDATDDVDEATRVANGCLSSRKRMHDSYQIISQNDIDRVGGNRDTFITVRGPSLPLRAVGLSFAAWVAMLFGDTDSVAAATAADDIVDGGEF